MSHSVRSLCVALTALLIAACGDSGDDGNNDNVTPQPVCGNGILETGEQCDDGVGNSDLEPDTCRSTCRTAYCGDGVRDSGEHCDDGDASSQNDACPSDCAEPVCGDGHVWAGHEACDDGNTSDDDDCSADCQQDYSLCGDGTIDAGEECDGAALGGESCEGLGFDYGLLSCDGDCRLNATQCRDLECGNSYVEQDNGEQCDGSNLGGQTCVSRGYTSGALSCDAYCQYDHAGCQSQCGNGNKEPDEQCDDGNTNPNDGCDNLCVVEWGYACPGNPSQCAATCGDRVAVALEACDGTDLKDFDCETLGYTGGTLNCAPDCTFLTVNCFSTCGNGQIETGEQCDDGRQDDNDGCNASCQMELGYTCQGQPSVCAPGCGDGLIIGAEECDDGNTTPGDGCGAFCTRETGYDCTGQPSQCTITCGDRIIAGAEQCDDGNTDSGDGCSVACQREGGWYCQGAPSSCFTKCNDGITAGNEECDDGNTTPGDGCNAICENEHGYHCIGQPSVCHAQCGDGEIAGGDEAEICDDGNTVNGDGCAGDCTAVDYAYYCDHEPSQCAPQCGDGKIAGGTLAEQCDDDNPVAGDGCSDSCIVERGYYCSGEASTCVPDCGDGIIAAGTLAEECDDNNQDPNDGCSDSCVVEDYKSCSGEPSACRCTVYVKPGATGSGASWSAATGDVNGAITTADSRGASCDVWVAAGTYYAYETSSGNSFVMASGVTLYGGFIGDELDFAARDWVANESILNGSDGGTNRVSKVVYGATNSAVDGLTITRAEMAGVFTDGNGSGFVVRNCYIHNISGYAYSAGVRAQSGTVSLSVYDTILENSVVGVWANDGVTLVEGCQFSNNSRSVWATSNAAITIRNSTVLNASYVGVYVDGGSTIPSPDPPHVDIVNCSMRAGVRADNGSAQAYNSILWGGITTNDGGTVTMTHSNTTVLQSGAGNISEDPLFTSSTDLHLQPGSPCIDVADDSTAPATDKDGNPRVDVSGVGTAGTAADMGAYEYQP